MPLPGPPTGTLLSAGADGLVSAGLHVPHGGSRRVLRRRRRGYLSLRSRFADHGMPSQKAYRRQMPCRFVGFYGSPVPSAGAWAGGIVGASIARAGDVSKPSSAVCALIGDCSM